VYVALVEDGKVPDTLKPAVITINPSDREAVRSFGVEVSEGEEAEGEDSVDAAAGPSAGPKAGRRGRKPGPKGKRKGKVAEAEASAAPAQEEVPEAGSAALPKRTKITIKRHKPSAGTDADTSVDSAAGGSTPAIAVAAAAPAPEVPAPPLPTLPLPEKKRGRGRPSNASIAARAQSQAEGGKQEDDARPPLARAPSASTPKHIFTALPGSPKGSPLYPAHASGSTSSAHAYAQYAPADTSYQANTPAGGDSKFRGKYLKVALKTWLKSIKDLTRPDGSSVVEFFGQLPNRTDYPDYYKVIKDPISIAEIEVSCRR
jgi:hypothetical protein